MVSMVNGFLSTRTTVTFHVQESATRRAQSRSDGYHQMLASNLEECSILFAPAIEVGWGVDAHDLDRNADQFGDFAYWGGEDRALKGYRDEFKFGMAAFILFSLAVECHTLDRR
jgi:hypothetical protein